MSGMSPRRYRPCPAQETCCSFYSLGDVYFISFNGKFCSVLPVANLCNTRSSYRRCTRRRRIVPQAGLSTRRAPRRDSPGPASPPAAPGDPAAGPGRAARGDFRFALYLAGSGKTCLRARACVWLTLWQPGSLFARPSAGLRRALPAPRFVLAPSFPDPREIVLLFSFYFFFSFFFPSLPSGTSGFEGKASYEMCFGFE